jgi:hypothetical protein
VTCAAGSEDPARGGHQPPAVGLGDKLAVAGVRHGQDLVWMHHHHASIVGR